MTNMKALLTCTCLFLAIGNSALASSASEIEQPQKIALQFNAWYLKQVSQEKYPIQSGDDLQRFITIETLKKLRLADQEEKKTGDSLYDADFFIKAQYIGDDWANNITVVSSDYDPVCTNVYIAFGKTRDHTVIDCMVKEDGAWKVQSVAAQDFH